jgi:hypothetical protein
MCGLNLNKQTAYTNTNSLSLSIYLSLALSWTIDDDLLPAMSGYLVTLGFLTGGDE